MYGGDDFTGANFGHKYFCQTGEVSYMPPKASFELIQTWPAKNKLFRTPSCEQFCVRENLSSAACNAFSIHH